MPKGSKICYRRVDWSTFDFKAPPYWTTSCDEPAKGEILAWSPEKFDLTNTDTDNNNDTETILSEVAASDLCSKQDEDQNILEMFANHVGKSPMESEEAQPWLFWFGPVCGCCG